MFLMIALDIIRRIPCRYYNYVMNEKNNPGYKTVGFIAQEVQSVLPNAVATYTDFIPNIDKKCINIQWLPISDSSNNSTDISDNFSTLYDGFL